MCILISCHQINLRHFDLCLLNSKAPRTHLIVSHDVSKQTLFCKRHSGMVDGPVLLKSLRLLTWQLNTSHIHFCMFSHQCHRLVVRIRCRKSFHPLPHAEFDHSPAEERKKSHLAPLHLQDPPLHWVLPRAHNQALHLLSCVTSSQATLGKPSCLLLDQPAKLWGTEPSCSAHRPTPTLRWARFASLQVHPQDKIYLYLALLISMLTPFHLQGLG